MKLIASGLAMVTVLSSMLISSPTSIRPRLPCMAVLYSSFLQEVKSVTALSCPERPPTRTMADATYLPPPQAGRHTLQGGYLMSTHGMQSDPCCVFPADGKTVTKDLFELKAVADGVYAAIAAPQYKINSNAAVILTNDGVVVVDSHSKPSAARALFQEIRGVTQQPIRKLINTHFHWDHWQGNEVYAAASSDLEIITSERTRYNLTTPDVGVGGVPYIETQLAALPKEIEQLQDDIRRASSPELKARMEVNLQQAEAFLEELKSLQPTLPTRTVAHSMTLHEPGREIQLLLLGRAHTDGDLFIYLPKEKVLATGDAVVDWMPFLGDGYPEDWIHPLDALAQVDF